MNLSDKLQLVVSAINKDGPGPAITFRLTIIENATG